MKTILKRGGYIYVTTRSRGFPYYAYPYDFWRYEPNDMLAIFRDFQIIRIETDWEMPGVFLKARKPVNWKPIDLSNITLYSIVLGRKVRDPVKFCEAPLARRLMITLLNSKVKWLLPGTILNLLNKLFYI
jgi:hypothetical protein